MLAEELTDGQDTIKETFTLREVPKEALYVGLAGVIPYLATSLSTVYLSFDIQYAASTGQGFLMSGETAEALLHIIEPIQLGYGASVRGRIQIINFKNVFTNFIPQDHFLLRCYPLGS